MNLHFNKTMQNSQFMFVVTTSNFEATDLALFQEFGEPTVNVGGKVLDANGNVYYTLPDQYIQVKSQFPFRGFFASGTATLGQNSITLPSTIDAETLAKLWESQVETNMQISLQTLRAKQDDFSGQDQVTL